MVVLVGVTWKADGAGCQRIFVEKKNRIKLITWNIARVRMVWETWLFLKKSDLILLQKTWVEKGKEKDINLKLSSEYICRHKFAVREKKKGRASGG